MNASKGILFLLHWRL